MILPGVAPSVSGEARGPRVVVAADSVATGLVAAGVNSPGWMTQNCGWRIELGMDSPLVSGTLNGAYKTVFSIRWVFEQSMVQYGDYLDRRGIGSGSSLFTTPENVLQYGAPSVFSAAQFEAGSREWQFLRYKLMNDPARKICVYTVDAQIRTLEFGVPGLPDLVQNLPDITSMTEMEDM